MVGEAVKGGTGFCMFLIILTGKKKKKQRALSILFTCNFSKKKKNLFTCNFGKLIEKY